MITREEIIEKIPWMNLDKQYKKMDEFINVKSGDYVLDCGAYFGTVSLYLMLRAGENGRVYAIEPDTFNFNRLCEWTEDLDCKKYITPIKLAISDKKETLKLYKSDNKTRHSTFQNLIENLTDYEEVKADTLRNIIYRYRIPKVDFIYMNMEGGEYKAFLDMEDIINKYRPNFCIDEHKNDIYKVKIPEILESYGYKVKIINDNPRDRVVITET
jgi:FkbM family methyltransferase